MGFYIRVDRDVKVYIVDINPAGRKTVFFVHGWPGNHNLFEYQFNYLLQKGYRCIGMDYRGFGQSDRPWTGYDYDQLADDIRSINRLNRKVEELKTQLETLRKAKGVAHPDTRFTFDDIVAHSDAGRTAKERAMRSAVSNSTVLLMGESGVGKEVFAHAIHHLSQRSRRPFVRVNCSAILE